MPKIKDNLAKMQSQLVDFIKKPSSKPKLMTLATILMIVTGSLFSFSLSGISKEAEVVNPSSDAQSLIKKVKTLKLSTQADIEKSLNFDGKVTNETEVRISASTPATVKTVNFTRGKMVKKGEILATLGGKTGPHPLQIQVAQAQTNLSNLDTSLQNLGDNNNNSLSRAKLQIETTQKGLDDLQKTYDLTKESTKITLTSADQALKNLEGDISRQEQTVKTNSDQVNASIDQQRVAAKSFIEQNSSGLINSLTSLAPTLGGYTTEVQLQINALSSFKTVEAVSVQNRLSDFQAALNNLISFVQSVIQSGNAGPAASQTLSVLASTTAAYKAQSVSQAASLGNSNINQQAGTIQGVNALDALKSKRSDLQIALDKARNGTQIQEQATLAQINSTTQQLQNTKLLLDAAQIGAQTQTDSTEGQRKLLQLQLQNAQSQLSSLTIMAPIDGIITDVKITPSQDVSAGLELVTVYGTGGKFVRGYLKPKDISNVKIDEVIDLTLSGDDQPNGKGRVIVIYPVADNITGLIPVDLEITEQVDSTSFVPGSAVQGKFMLGKASKQETSIFIPTTAVSIDGDKKFVWVIESGKAVKKVLTLGVSNNDSVEILSGLKGDEEIILTDLSNIKEGDKVDV